MTTWTQDDENKFSRDDGATVARDPKNRGSKPWFAHLPGGQLLDASNGRHGRRRRCFSTHTYAIAALERVSP